MASDPWFVDLNGSVNLEAETAKREAFYKKILAIGQAVQTVLQNAPQPKVSEPSQSLEKSTARPTASVASNTSPIFPPSAVQHVSQSADGAKRKIAAQRRELEARLAAVKPPQWTLKTKTQPEDIQELDPALDIDDILTRAHYLVPPVSGLVARRSPASESFDENDYYSSQANSWHSSPKTDGAAAVAAIAEAPLDASDGEIVEEDLEPVPSSLMPMTSVPGTQHVEHAHYEPVMPAEEDGEDDYEPPAVESPPYEPAVLQSAPQQLMKTLTGPPLAPRAISINHIRSPVAPQPSHISPLTNASFAQHLDHSAEQSSKSDQEYVPAGVQKKVKGKNRRSFGTSPKTKTALSKQKVNPKKRKRPEETETRANKRRSHGDDLPYIKQEPVSPPALSSAPVLGPHLHKENRGNGYHAAANHGEAVSTPFSVPAGYKLVPIAGETPDITYPTYQAAPMPAPQQYSRPILRDDRGIEYYAYLEPASSHHSQAHSLPSHQRTLASAAYQSFPSPAPRSGHEDMYQRSDPRITSAAYSHPLHERHYGSDGHHLPQQQAAFSRSDQHSRRMDGRGSVALDDGRSTYGHAVGFADHGSARADPGFHMGPPRPPQQYAHSNAFDIQRAHSVLPQAYGHPGHHPGVGMHQTPVPLPNRASSVYPSAPQFQPAVPYLPNARAGDEYVGHVAENTRQMGRY